MPLAMARIESAENTQSWLSFGLKAWQIGLGAKSVIALRMLRLAAAGARAEAEASRMVTEKVLAACEAQMTAAMAAMGGHKST
jgi:hypothetical protein